MFKRGDYLMTLRKVYVPLSVKKDGKWYETFEVPEGVPLGNEVLYEGPPEELQFPKWDSMQGKWIEDKDSIIESFKQQITDLQDLVLNVIKGGGSNE